MKVLVTGATGFLGSYLCKVLQKEGHEVLAVGSKACDLTCESSLNQFNNHFFDQIYHLAAWVQAGDFNVHHQGEIWEINQKINTNMLSWWKNKQPQAKMITMGTSCSYGDGMELKEENYLQGLPHQGLFAYAMTKRMLYTGLISMNRQFGLKYLCLVPNTLYGPGYPFKGKQAHFIFDLIRKIIGASQGGPPAVLWGDGTQKRELVYIGDFVRALFRLSCTEENQLINIGPGKEHSIRDFAQTICDHIGYDSKLIEYDSSKFVGVKSKYFNNQKLQSLLPDFEFTPLKEGLRGTIDWFLTKDVVMS